MDGGFQPKPLPASLSDEDHARILTPPFLRRRHAQEEKQHDPVSQAAAIRLAEIRDDSRPVTLEELSTARHRALRNAIRRHHEMKPAELMQLIGLLDGEIAAKAVVRSEGEAVRKVTREEMIAKLSQHSEVQK